MTRSFQVETRVLMVLVPGGGCLIAGTLPPLIHAQLPWTPSGHPAASPGAQGARQPWNLRAKGILMDKETKAGLNDGQGHPASQQQSKAVAADLWDSRSAFHLRRREFLGHE